MSGFLAACSTAAAPAGGPAYDSVRDRLTATATRLQVAPAESTADVTVSHWTHDGWIDGSLAVGIDNAQLVAKADEAGQIEVQDLSISFTPIDFPPGVFSSPARLQDVRLVLADKPEVTTTWTDGDDATVTANIKLDLQWSIWINNAVTPLGTQHLPAVPVDLALTGAGDHVDAAIGLHASGQVWSWAGLIKLTDLELQLAASAE